MSQDATLNFDTPMINNSTGKPILHPTIDELKNCGIIPYSPTGIPEVDQPKQIAYEEALSNNIDNLSKYTLSNALIQMFDVTPMANNSDFALYNGIIIDIRHAKQNNSTTINISKSELEKFKKIFESKPPQNPQFNKLVGFILECLEESYVNIINPEIKNP